MMRLQMSAAGAGLFRALLKKAGVSRDQVLLTSYRATDWHSLTFAGERHEYMLRLPGLDHMPASLALVLGLSDAEFDVPGQIVADIWGAATPSLEGDAVALRIEALTVEA